MPSIFDKTDIYKRDIEGIVKDLVLKCDMHQIPLFVTAAVKNNEAGTKYETNMVLASTGRHLKDPKVGQCALHVYRIKEDQSINTPKRIKDAMRVVEDYYNSIYGSDVTILEDVELTDDAIGGLAHIANGGGSIDVVKDMNEDLFSDVFAD